MKRILVAALAGLLLLVISLTPGSSALAALHIGQITYNRDTLYTNGSDSMNLYVQEGVPPYTVTASNSNLKIAPYPGRTYIFMVSPVAPGKTMVTVRDAKGATVTHEFTIALPLKYRASTTQPNVGDKMTIELSGGVPPYTLRPCNPDTGTVRTLSPATFEIVPKDTHVSFDAKDSKRAALMVNITAKAKTAFIAPLKSSVTYGEITVGSGDSLTVSGGTPPYTVTTSNSCITITPFSSPGIYNIKGKTPGATLITIRDSKGMRCSNTITVRYNGPPLYCSITAESVAVNKMVELRPMGGAPPYGVSAADAKVQIISRGGNVFQIWGKAPGDVNLFISDSVGGKMTKKVKILASQMTVSHPLSSECVGTTGKFTVTGGLPPYTVATSNNNITVTTTAPGVYAYKDLAPGVTVVTVKDSAGYASRFTVDIRDILRFNISPTVFHVGETSTLTVSGGKGPYTVAANSTGVKIEAVNSVTFRITGVSPATVGITVKDSQNKSSYRPITVTPFRKMTARLALNVLIVGEPTTLIIAYGDPPFQVVSSVNNVTISPRGTYYFNIKAERPGSTQINVKDSRGQMITLGLEVKEMAPSIPKPQPFDYAVTLTTGAKYTLSIDGMQQLKLSGGLQPYSVVAENAQLVQIVQQARDTFTIRAIRKGVTNIILRDRAGKIIRHALRIL